MFLDAIRRVELRKLEAADIPRKQPHENDIRKPHTKITTTIQGFVDGEISRNAGESKQQRVAPQVEAAPR